jgi:hypothetical protein
MGDYNLKKISQASDNPPSLSPKQSRTAGIDAIQLGLEALLLPAHKRAIVIVGDSAAAAAFGHFFNNCCFALFF